MDSKLIGKYLLMKRKEKGITQKELADSIGVTYQAVSRWENGDSIPDIAILDFLADYYNVSVDEILQRVPKINSEKTRYLPEESFDILVTVLFWVFNLIGIGLTYLFSLLKGDIFIALSYISFFMFLISANLILHIHFLYGVKKKKRNIMMYLRNYQMYLVVFSMIILLVTNLSLYVLVSLFLLLSLIGFTILMELAYQDIIPTKLISYKSYSKLKWFLISIILIGIILTATMANPISAILIVVLILVSALL